MDKFQNAEITFAMALSFKKIFEPFQWELIFLHCNVALTNFLILSNLLNILMVITQNISTYKKIDGQDIKQDASSVTSSKGDYFQLRSY